MASSSDICVFTLLIVYGVDIVEHIVETASPSKIDLRDEDKTERFWNHVSRKNYYLGWIILLSLVALQFNGGQILCAASKKNPTWLPNCFFGR